MSTVGSVRVVTQVHMNVSQASRGLWRELYVNCTKYSQGIRGLGSIVRRCERYRSHILVGYPSCMLVGELGPVWWRQQQHGLQTRTCELAGWQAGGTLLPHSDVTRPVLQITVEASRQCRTRQTVDSRMQAGCRKESAGECPYRVTRRPPWLTPLQYMKLMIQDPDAISILNDACWSS